MPDAWLSFAREFGLPLAMLAAFIWMVVIKRYLVPRAESEGWRTLYERERQDRMAAEQTAAKGSAASADVADAVADLGKIVLERLPATSVYDERMGPRRGR